MASGHDLPLDVVYELLSYLHPKEKIIINLWMSRLASAEFALRRAYVIRAFFPELSRYEPGTL
jgi:hypothetical protein